MRCKLLEFFYLNPAKDFFAMGR